MSDVIARALVKLGETASGKPLALATELLPSVTASELALYPWDESSPLFADVLAARLAAELALALTGSAQIRQAALSEYQAVATAARLAESRAAPPAPLAEDTWLKARFS